MPDKDKKFTMEIIVHTADISNPAKPWDLCQEWTVRIMAEYWEQVYCLSEKNTHWYRVTKKENLDYLLHIYAIDIQQM